jgi:hypothetical protein
MIPLSGGAATALMLAVVAVKGADLSYTFRYDEKPLPHLIVDLRFHVSAVGPKQLVLPSQYGGQNEMWRSISILEANRRSHPIAAW